MDPKQPNLNGAYYGPPIPPPQSYGRRRNCSSSCGSCLCSVIKFLFAIVVILGIIVLILWLVFRPNEIKVYVTSATLAQFNLSASTITNNNNNNGSLLKYDLSLDMAFRNPNRHIGIYYDYAEAFAAYHGGRFGYARLPSFYQGHKNTTDLFPAFKGQGLVVDNSLRTTYDRERSEGFYYVDVTVYTKMRLKVAFLKIHVKPDIDCTLKLPVPGKGGPAGSVGFEATACNVDFF